MKGMVRVQGKLTGFRQDGARILLQYEQGRAEVEAVAPGILRFFVPGPEDAGPSRAIEQRQASSCAVTVQPAAGGVSIRTARLRAEVTADFRVDIFDAAGAPLCRDYRGKREPFARPTGMAAAASWAPEEKEDPPALPVLGLKELPEGTNFYGFGDKTGPLNKRGYCYWMWNTDCAETHTERMRTLYKSIPFFIAQRGEQAYGIFFDNTFRTYFDMGRENSRYYFFGAPCGSLDYYFIYGPSIKEVVAGYTALTGRTPLPQLWTLGYQQCRWSYAPKERLLAIADEFRARHIPCDTLYLDIDYMDGYRVFTYDPKRFAGFPDMIRSLRARGFRVVTIIDPGVKKDAGYSVFDEGLKNGYFLTDADGVPYVNAVWPGAALFPDFSRPEVRAWWAKKQRFLIDSGVAGVWNDMNEPASFNGPLPDDIRFANDGHPATHARMHNVYGHLMAKAAFEGWKATGRRPFVITRACYAGTQKYSTVWTGDNQSLWEHLRMSLPQLMNLGLSGFGHAGCDVGGFSYDCTAELLARWTQAGCFAPLFRNHSGNRTRSQEPWAFGEATERICRKYIELRYTLLPYLYDVMREGERTGLPMIRPLVLEFQNDPAVWDLNDQFLCGGDLLVAPVVQQGQRARSVYLPAGGWVDFWTGETFAGSRYLVRDTPLDVCPLYIRAGGVLPRGPVQQYVGETPVTDLELDICLPAPGGSSVRTHCTDDGETFEYRRGGYNEYTVTVSRDGGRARLRVEKTHAGYAGCYESLTLRLMGARAVSAEGSGCTLGADGIIRVPGETADVTVRLG